MKINNFSNLIIGTLIATGAGIYTGCTYNNYDKSAKREALQYLNESDTKQALRTIQMQDKSYKHITPITAYWDSILLAEKVKQAFAEGKEFVLDSINNKFHRNKHKNNSLNKLYKSADVNDDIREQLSDLLTTDEFNQYLSNEPEQINEYRIALGASPAELHYWNQITIDNKEAESFEKGKTFMLDSLSKK